MPLVSSLYDTFPDPGELSGKWVGHGATVTSSGQLAVDARTLDGGPVYSHARSSAGYTLHGSTLTVEVTAMPGPVGSGAFAQVWVMDPQPDTTVARLGFEYVAAANRLDFLGQAGDDYAPIGTTQSVTFDPVAHRWLRLRHTGTIITWETSPNGVTWLVERAMLTGIPAWVAKGTLLVSIEAYRTTGANDTFRVDNVNAPPGTVPPSEADVPTTVSELAWVTAIESSDQRPVYRLLADWNRTGHFDHQLSDLTDLVDQVTVDRALSTDATIDLVEGYASASLKATLHGQWPGTDLTPAEVFAPYRPDSPLYGWPLVGTPVQLDTGFITDEGERLERRFTGTVRRISPRSGGRTVSFEALDPAHRMRRPVTIPSVAAYEWIMTRYGPEQYRARINSQWLVDYILRKNGVYASPPPRADAVLSVTAHGSFVPEIGWGGAPESVYPTYRGAMWTNTDHPYGMLRPIGLDIGRWWLTTPLTALPGTGFGMSMLQRLPGPKAQREEYLSFDVSVDKSWGISFGFDTDGRPYIGIDGPAANDIVYSKPLGWAPGAADRFTFLGVHIAFGATTMTTRWRIDGQEFTNTVTIAARAAGVWKPDVVANFRWKSAFTNFQLWLSPTAPQAGTPWTGEVWTSQADLDPGANEWTGLPDILGEDGRTIIKEICAAEGSRFEFDENGRAKFITRVGDALRGVVQTPVETITADRNLQDLVSTVDESSVRNIITIKTARLLLSDWEDYYKAESVDQFLCGTGTTFWDVELPSAAYEVPPPLSTFGSLNNPGAWNAYGGDGYIYYGSNEAWSNSSKQENVKQFIRVMVNNADSPTNWVGAGVQIRVERLSPWLMRIIVHNEMPHRIRFATMDTVDAQSGTVTPGQPALIIPARMVKAAPEQLETLTDPASVDTYGPSTYAVGGAQRWAQDTAMLRARGQLILPRTAQPLPVLDAHKVTHDPRRRIGQQHVLADPDGLGSTTANLHGLSTTFSSAGATDSITSRPIVAPGF